MVPGKSDFCSLQKNDPEFFRIFEFWRISLIFHIMPKLLSLRRFEYENLKFYYFWDSKKHAAAIKPFKLSTQVSVLNYKYVDGGLVI